jgi:glutathione S-transferase
MASPMAVLLYDLPLSHYCVKVKRILDHKRIPYETERAPYHDRQDLLAVSGQDYVPYLLWEDEGVEWPRIPDFLEAKKPEPTIYPDGTRNVARMLESWAHNVVEEVVWRYVVSDAPKTFDDPRERWVFEEMQTRSRGPLEVMALRKQEFLKGVVGTLAPAEDRLKESTFLLSEAPSLADFALYGAVHPLPFTGNAIPTALPNVRAWFERVAKL